ncbi:MAG: 5'(3')-deoxyribonucleotidase [Bacteroidota bacterium]|nr:5'(3')-deoxyribonucleotidase [Bacteroidota bacterium]
MLTLSVDMDEVITDTAKKLRDWYTNQFGIVFSNEDLHGKDLKHAVKQEHFSKFHEYLNAPGFFGDLEIMANAREVLEELNNKYDLYIVSAALEFPNSLKDKYDWIAQHLPFITWRQICLCGNKSIVQTDIMIDDRTRNFSHFQGRKILYTQHHNIFEENYERVSNWQEIEEKLL